jgi:hypothetical protein
LEEVLPAGIAPQRGACCAAKRSALRDRGVQLSMLPGRTKMSSIERLYSGVFECRDCAARYDIQDASDDELLCSECDGSLILSDDEATEEESEE